MQHFLLALLVLFLISCSRESSQTTGWDYNDPKNGGFQKVPYLEQETGPGLVLIEGGTFEIFLEQDSIISEKKMEVVVPSYYLDQYEVTNQSYCEYLYWTKRTFGTDFPLVHMNALPDTLVWENEMGKANNFVTNYLRHPAYANYPVVGVSWMQANNYCEWRTDRVNEFILIREGVLVHNPSQVDEDHFNTQAYLAGQYMSGINAKLLPDLNPNRFYGNKPGERIVRLEDGILLPKYRLPTEVEWEYAASSGVTLDKKLQKKLDESLIRFGRYVNPAYNNDNSFNALSVVPVDAFVPNDFGVYNLSGNVSEWVADTYIVRTDTSITSFSPFVGIRTPVPVESLHYKNDEKLNLVIYDIGLFEHFTQELKQLYLADHPTDSQAYDVFKVTDEYITLAKEYEASGNYLDAADLMMVFSGDVLDGFQLRHETHSPNGYRMEYPLLISVKKCLAKSILDIPGNIQYQDVSPYDRIKFRNNSSLNYPFYDSVVEINDQRVFKGANWKDTGKWITPAYRRHMNKFEASALVGFRCAMDRVGAPVGLGKKNKK